MLNNVFNFNLEQLLGSELQNLNSLKSRMQHIPVHIQRSKRIFVNYFDVFVF